MLFEVHVPRPEVGLTRGEDVGHFLEELLKHCHQGGVL